MSELECPASHDGAHRFPTLAPEDALRREMELLNRVAAGTRRFAVSVWSTDRCLVAPGSITRRAGFGEAKAAMAARGWPVLVRGTGGDVTPLTPGVINVSTAFVMSPDRPQRIQEAYGRLCEPILDTLGRLGISAHCAAVPGSFCDGAYNIVVAGKKLAGTAQRWRRMAAPNPARRSFAVLAHGSILCDVDLAEMVKAVNDFHGLCRLERRARRDRHTTLAELLPARTRGTDRGDFLRSTAMDLKTNLQRHFAD